MAVCGQSSHTFTSKNLLSNRYEKFYAGPALSVLFKGFMSINTFRAVVRSVKNYNNKYFFDISKDSLSEIFSN